MTDNKIKSDVQIEDLPKGIWRDFAKTHGIEPILGLAKVLGGSSVYVPSMSSILRESRNRAIREGMISPTLSKRQIERICRN
jgi:hypothetical protein